MHIRRRWTESEGNWSQIEFFMSFKGFRMSRESWRGCVTALESRSRVIRKPATTDEMQSWILDTFACLWSPTSVGLVGLTHRNVLVMLSEALQPPSCRFVLNHQENSRSTNDMAEKFFSRSFFMLSASSSSPSHTLSQPKQCEKDSVRARKENIISVLISICLSPNVIFFHEKVPRFFFAMLAKRTISMI